MNLTYNELHVILDALMGHAATIDAGHRRDGMTYGESVFGTTHPLRDQAKYRAFVDSASGTINEALAASADASVTTLTVTG